MLYLSCEKNENKQKRPGLARFLKKHLYCSNGQVYPILKQLTVESRLLTVVGAAVIMVARPPSARTFSGRKNSILFLAGPSQDVFLLPHIPYEGKGVVYFLYITL